MSKISTRTVSKMSGVLAGLAVVSTLTYGYWGFDHSVAEATSAHDRSDRQLDGCSSWCNIYTCSLSSCSDCATCSSSAPLCAAWCNQYTCDLQWCSACGIDKGCHRYGTQPCDGWCNGYTCGSERCAGCGDCMDLSNGAYCASWCNSHVCSSQYCSGCTSCGYTADIDVNPKVSRVPSAAAGTPTSTSIAMTWDRMQAEEKTNLYGRLLDNFPEHCEVDGYCFGDLFADDAWICTVSHTNVSNAFPDFSSVYPGAPALPSGKTVVGPACTAGMGAGAQAAITAAFQSIYGKDGIFRTNGHQPRHTVNNFVVTHQDATSMTTQHYQIIERYFRFEGSNAWTGYDGSGYTVQLKWSKEGAGYTGLWKITQMVEVHNGDGHMGLPPDSTLPQFQEFINAQRAVGGLAPLLARRKLSNWKPPKRKLQGTSRFGDIDPLKTMIPNPASDKDAVQMAWDRLEMLERISMYSWLADETRTNFPAGFAWGDLYADGGMWCATALPGTYEFPNFDDFEEGVNAGGGPCPVGSVAPSGCKSSCTPFMGGHSQTILQTMITMTFGAGGFAQQRYQQTRHTLTNKIFLDQTLTTAKSWVYNTLERFIKGVALDGSFFFYQHEWIKERGVWKWAKISAITQGHSHLAGGLPQLTEWDPWMVGINNYPGNTGHESFTRRQLQAPGPGYATQGGTFNVQLVGPIAADVVNPNVQLNPRVSRTPVGATNAIENGDYAAAAQMAWDRLEITERLNMYPWLADERRRNAAMGYRWGDLYADNSYFCQFNHFNISKHRPTWDELKPGYPGTFGIPGWDTVAPGTGAENSCTDVATAPYSQDAMQSLTNGFGFNGPFLARNQQTRHTFSNYVFLMQTTTAAATLNYNIVERFVNGIAMDGSNFLYHMSWSKVGYVWKAKDVKVIHFGDDRLTPLPTVEGFAAWQEFIQSAAFI